MQPFELWENAMDSKTSLNILYLHSHDTGRYLNVYGYPTDTPNLRELAQHAITFRNAFSVAPTCSPSRSGLLTGTYPHENGMLGLAHRGFRLHNPDQHLARYLQRYGYDTLLCGVQHVASDKAILGYNKVLDDQEEYFTREIQDLEAYDTKNAERVARFLKHKPRSPFFLSYGMLNTHRPFPEASTDSAQFLRPPVPIPDTPASRADTAQLYRAVHTMDRCVGIVLQALVESGLDDNTVILYTTDHGIAFPNMKATLYDSGTGVAMIVRLPQGENSGRVVEPLVSQLDIFPTLCELTGIPVPEWTRGNSLIPLLEGRTQRLRPYIFTESTFHAAYEPARAIRSSRYKLITYFGERRHLLMVNIDDSPSKRLFFQNGYFSRERDREQLFDLYLDPAEKDNRRDDPAYRSIYQALHDELFRWMERTGDPLLQGEIEIPSGVLVNSPESYSPEEDLIGELQAH